MNKEFCTNDIFLSTALMSLGYPISSLAKASDRKVKFYFQGDQRMDEIIQKYWAQKLSIEPQAFSANLKILKSRIYDFNKHE
ncbi:DUF5659 domain-containing protein [Patescibacteria group bacterium]